MAARGELSTRADGKWAFRVKASNGEVVATDAGRGYSAKASARSTAQSTPGRCTKPAMFGGTPLAVRAPAHVSRARVVATMSEEAG